MRRIFSVIDAPTTAIGTSEQQPTNAGPDKSSTKAYDSQTYFKSITRLLDDLRRQKPTAKTIGQVGLWLDKYARKIDRLSVLNVDDDLVQGVGARRVIEEAPVLLGAADELLADVLALIGVPLEILDPSSQDLNLLFESMPLDLSLRHGRFLS